MYAVYSSYLMHHGVKGQKWGVRRYQYTDGSLTPYGRRHYGYGNRTFKQRTANAVLNKYTELKIKNDTRGAAIGKKYADTVLKSGTSVYRIQSNDQFENFAFYGTFKKHDVEQYAGLFGKNLINRAKAEARNATKNEQYDEQVAKALTDKANNMKIYQLNIQLVDRLKVPSEKNASHIVGNLLKDQEFSTDLKAAITDSASKMRRPSQQALFKEASKSMTKDPSKMTDSDRSVIYKALNLSLTNHNEQEIRMQNKFYKAMKDNGYSALLDLNDKSYSSYHAHNPVIIFDTDKVKLQSVTRMDSDKIDSLYKKYNRERIRKDIPEQLLGNYLKYADMKISKISSYAVNSMNDYLKAS